MLRERGYAPRNRLSRAEQLEDRRLLSAGAAHQWIAEVLGYDPGDRYPPYEAGEVETHYGPQNSPHIPVVGDSVLMNVVTDGEASGVLDQLEAIGMDVTAISRYMVNGFLPVQAMDKLAAMTDVRFASPAYVALSVGAVTSQGDQAQRSDQLRDALQLDGTGLTVGVISDSFDLLGGADADVASGDLPPGIDTEGRFKEGGSGTDEGRALLQIVHDVAPGAELLFHAAAGG